MLGVVASAVVADVVRPVFLPDSLRDRINAMRVLADHCARLLREKETLQRRLYAMQESKTNPLQWHSHEPGKPCTEYCKTIPTRPQL